MPAPADISDGDHWVTDLEQLRALYNKPGDMVIKKVLDRLDDFHKGFLREARFAAVAFHDDEAVPSATVIGGAPGFMAMEGPRHLRIAGPGTGPIAERYRDQDNRRWRLGFNVIVPGFEETLRLNGFLTGVMPGGAGRAAGLRFEVETAYFHCAKAFIRSKAWRGAAAADGWRGKKELVCLHAEDESAVIRSFYLRPADGSAIPAYLPGQYLPIELDIPGQAHPVTRTYTLSNRPGEEALRISVKRELEPALASPHLHRALVPGATIMARSPRGEFFLDEGLPRPVVLVSGGVGLTPMVAMLDHLVESGPKRGIWFLHAAISGAHHAFRGHVEQIAATHAGVRKFVCYERPGPGDLLGVTHDFEGRLSVDLLTRILPWDDYDFYICGPGPFMEAMIAGLRAKGVSEDRIRWESFSRGGALPGGAGAASEAPAAGSGAGGESAGDEGTGPTVRFARSGKMARWTATAGSLLDLAERSDIRTSSNCRNGDCFTCQTALLQGEVEYLHELAELPDEGEVLLCSAAPKGDIVLDL